MILSLEQLEAIDRGEPFPVSIDERECVVVRKDVYDR